MNVKQEKKRTANFTPKEKSILTKLVAKYKNIIENKCNDSSTNLQKTTGWIELAKEYNNVSTDCHRTPNNLKTCWENIKRQTKKEVTLRKKQIFMTGGGKLPAPSANSNSIVETILGPALEGLPHFIHNSNDLNVCENCGQQNGIGKIPDLSKKSAEPEKALDNEGLWKNWTPKNLKRPISEVLRSGSRQLRQDCSADILLREKIELVKILKKNVEEEGNLKLSILKEQLKQEKIKTENFIKNIVNVYL